MFGLEICTDPSTITAVLQRGRLCTWRRCAATKKRRDYCFPPGADARFEDPVDRFCVLHEADYGGHEQLVKDMLIADADPSRLSSAPSRISPLHQAALGGHPSIVSALLLKGVAIDVLDGCGGSPLIWAADEGQLAAAEALLAAGAKFNIRSTDRKNSGCAALDCAAYHGYAHILKAILAHGADANARDYRGLAALHTAAGADQAGI
ncbi:Ankyrin repeat protein [Ectocarpus siliculosus]|uniref:Ankyrin repeat protein n=1 Tax=Ectocarpus siliculosus TaxID=2880 RepID=D7G661_ECTSI|nr:Ankyrin repeat protein [Ectocarpus siliculosus]|eukprot:CBJ27470.1 Ankyrin repeat protein [Ectocarpus siliculosus]